MTAAPPPDAIGRSAVRAINPAGEYCQRWRNRDHTWRHRRDGGFDARHYDVAMINDDTTARQFVETHHYSGSYPAARLRCGLYDRGDLVGVAVFGVPMQAKVLTSAFPRLQPYTEALELSRFVLVDDVPANAESWFLGQAFRLIASDGIRGVVAFADPVPRGRADGAVVFPGHVGTIYQASNGLFTASRGTARTLLVGPDARVISARALQKVRAESQGHAYVERQLVEWGAAARDPDEDAASWLRTALEQAGVRRVRHPGNYRYLFRVGSPSQRRGVVVGLPPARYPKTVAA